jgi:tetratricopeptide (TPR) repeat protein
VVRLAPKEARAWAERALFRASPNVRDSARAADDFSKALDLLPDEPPWKPAENWLWNAPKSLPEEVFSRLLAIRPKDGRLRAILGWHLTTFGKLAEADTLFNEATRLRPNCRDLLWNSARFHAGRGRWERSAEDMEAVLKIADHQYDSFAWAEAAAYLAAGGKMEAQRALCLRMLEHFKKRTTDDTVAAHIVFACLLGHEVGDPKAVLLLAEQPLKTDGRSPWNVSSAALARIRTGQAESAVSLVRDYLATNEHRKYGPQDEIVLRLALGMGLVALTKTDEAQQEFKTATAAFEARFPPGKEPPQFQNPPHGWATVKALLWQAQPLMSKE